MFDWCVQFHWHVWVSEGRATLVNNLQPHKKRIQLCLIQGLQHHARALPALTAPNHRTFHWLFCEYCMYRRHRIEKQNFAIPRKQSLEASRIWIWIYFPGERRVLWQIQGYWFLQKSPCVSLTCEHPAIHGEGGMAFVRPMASYWPHSFWGATWGPCEASMNLWLVDFYGMLFRYWDQVWSHCPHGVSQTCAC